MRTLNRSCRPEERRSVFRCAKHPRRRQSSGVCALCLSEKLYGLLGSSPCEMDNSASFTSSSVSNHDDQYSSSSSDISGGPSPLHYRYILATIEAKNSLMAHRKGKESALKKKVVVVEEEEEEGRKRSSGGVWYRLFMGLRRKNKELVISRPLKLELW